MIYAENILICIAVPLLLSLVFLRDAAREVLLFALLGMLMCLLSAYISGYLQVSRDLSVENVSVYLAPIVEEIMKLLPLLLFLFLFASGDDQLFRAAIGIGVGFATFENCCNLLTLGAESLRFVLIRGFAVGIMHIVSMTALGLALIAARRFHVLTAAGILGALSLSVTVHGLYNLLVSAPGVFTYIGYALPVAAAAGLYLPYRALRNARQST